MAADAEQRRYKLVSRSSIPVSPFFRRLNSSGHGTVEIYEIQIMLVTPSLAHRSASPFYFLVAIPVAFASLLCLLPSSANQCKIWASRQASSCIPSPPSWRFPLRYFIKRNLHIHPADLRKREQLAGPLQLYFATATRLLLPLAVLAAG